jgi:ABC-type multidrug transport system fused ATPase/permease subunit
MGGRLGTCAARRSFNPISRAVFRTITTSGFPPPGRLGGRALIPAVENEKSIKVGEAARLDPIRIEGDSLIELQNVTVRRDERVAPMRTLSSLQGEQAILGPNGSGKSTLIN